MLLVRAGSNVSTVPEVYDSRFPDPNDYAMHRDKIRGEGVALLKQMAEEKPAFAAALEGFRAYARRRRIPERALLLNGHPKSGNTWMRMLYCNLMNVESNNATETMTYSRMNEIQNNMDFPHMMYQGLFCKPIGFESGCFPLMFHSHRGWEPAWPGLCDVLFVYRNPLDSMVGTWYAKIVFDKQHHGSMTADEYAFQQIPVWLANFATAHPNADVVLRYEDILACPHILLPEAFRRLGVHFDADLFQRAVAMSTFESMREMEDQHGEFHGHQIYNDRLHNASFGRGAPREWREGSGVRFTRSGKIGQWKRELKPSTVEAILKMLSDRGLREDLFVFE
jgi:sulfotransferase family protein